MNFIYNKDAQLTLLTIVTFHLSLLLCISTNSYGQEETNNIPELNGHVFIPNTYIEDPFMNSTFNLGV